MKRDKVFISYCHKDGKWLDKLRTILSPLLDAGVIDIWSDREIKPWEKWESKINEALSQAKVGVLLVSGAFLASDYIRKKERPYIAKASEKGDLRLFWVAVGHCLYEDTEIAEYQCANDPEKPLESLGEAEQNKILAEISNLLREAFQTP